MDFVFSDGMSFSNTNIIIRASIKAKIYHKCSNPMIMLLMIGTIDAEDVSKEPKEAYNDK
nr:hypothetical protein [Dysgonomonas macrotermitis]